MLSDARDFDIGGGARALRETCERDGIALPAATGRGASAEDFSLLTEVFCGILSTGARLIVVVGALRETGIAL
jgi:hypothetical protein